jgi:hypothetical protein
MSYRVRRQMLGTIYAASAFVACHGVAATLAIPNAQITTILSSSTDPTGAADNRFGACMAKISPSPRSRATECKPNWVTFDCQGDLGTRRDLANQVFQIAQMAMLTGSRLNLHLDTAKTIDGFCFAYRADLLPPPE